jgi:hypothetical protein
MSLETNRGASMKAKALEAIGNLDLREIAQIEAARGDERTPRTRVGGGRAPRGSIQGVRNEAVRATMGVKGEKDAS